MQAQFHRVRRLDTLARGKKALTIRLIRISISGGNLLLIKATGVIAVAGYASGEKLKITFASNQPK